MKIKLNPLLPLVLLAILFGTIAFIIITPYNQTNEFLQFAALRVVAMSFSFCALVYYWRTQNVLGMVILFGIIMMTIPFIAFNNWNPFETNFGDYWYMNALVTKNKFYNYLLVDSTIKDIPTYLAPLYFIFTGKLAWLFDIESYEILIFVSKVSVLILPIGIYYLLKDRFEESVIILSIIVISVFHDYEILMKPYQSISTVMALIFYFKFLPKLEYTAKRNMVKTVLFGTALFLLYFYHFIYLALAFFLELALKYYNIFSFSSKQGIKNKFLGYFLIFMAAFFLFILPHIISILKVGSVHSIYFGSWNHLHFEFLQLPLVLGLFQLLRNIENPEYQRPLVLFLGLVMLFVLQLFFVSILHSNLFVYKIIHLANYILVPFTIQFIYHFVFDSIENPKLKFLSSQIFITIILLFSVTVWAGDVQEHKTDKNILENVINKDFINKYKTYTNLKDKNIFFPIFYQANELGSVLPNYRFLSTNIDFGSQSSQLAKRIQLYKDLDSAKTNPALFAYLITNNPFEKIDYFYWDSSNPSLYTYEVQKIGNGVSHYESQLNHLIFSPKYFKKVHPNLCLYSISTDFSKGRKKMTILEKRAMELNSNPIRFSEIKEDLLKHQESYTNYDIINIIYHLNHTGQNNYCDSLFEVVKKVNPNLLSLNFETEFSPSSYTAGQLNFVKSNKYSNGFARSLTSHESNSGGALVFGPYLKLPKGKYRVIYNFQSKEIHKLVGTADICAYGGTKILNSGQIISKTGLIDKIELDFEATESLEAVEFRVHSEKGQPLIVDNIQLKFISDL